MRTTFVVWCHGDRTVGDGTFNAKVELDEFPECHMMLAKDVLQDAFSKIWDYRTRDVHVMTQEEYDEYASDVEASE